MSVLRSTILLVVWTLVAGANAPLFCDGWCDRSELGESTAETSCTHAQPGVTARLADTDSCQPPDPAPIEVVREQTRRTGSSPVTVLVQFTGARPPDPLSSEAVPMPPVSCSVLDNCCPPAVLRI